MTWEIAQNQRNLDVTEGGKMSFEWMTVMRRHLFQRKPPREVFSCLPYFFLSQLIAFYYCSFSSDREESSKFHSSNHPNNARRFKPPSEWHFVAVRSGNIWPRIWLYFQPFPARKSTNSCYWTTSNGFHGAISNGLNSATINDRNSTTNYGSYFTDVCSQIGLCWNQPSW